MFYRYTCAFTAFRSLGRFFALNGCRNARSTPHTVSCRGSFFAFSIGIPRLICFIVVARVTIAFTCTSCIFTAAASVCPIRKTAKGPSWYVSFIRYFKLNIGAYTTRIQAARHKSLCRGTIFFCIAFTTFSNVLCSEVIIVWFCCACSTQ